MNDPEITFNWTMRDIQACLPNWDKGSVVAGDIDGRDADQGSKNVTFMSSSRKIILELDRWSDEKTRWNFISLYVR